MPQCPLRSPLQMSTFSLDPEAHSAYIQIINTGDRQMTTINHQEAGAFITHALMLGLDREQILAEAAHTTWPDPPEDLMFGRRRHAPTIRRLIRIGWDRLEAEAEKEQAQRDRAKARTDAVANAYSAEWAAASAKSDRRKRSRARTALYRRAIAAGIIDA